MTPPAGRPPGERPIASLEPYTARFTPEAKARLLAAARVLGKPAYLLLEEAWMESWRRLSPEDRGKAEQLMKLEKGAT